MTSPYATCERCGRRRYVHHGRQNVQCRGCMYLGAIPEPRECDALIDGHWATVRGIQTWVPTPRCHCGQLLVGPSCDTCLTWAERDARLHAEAQVSRANRGRIWDILDARKSVLEGVA